MLLAMLDSWIEQITQWKDDVSQIGETIVTHLQITSPTDSATVSGTIALTGWTTVQFNNTGGLLTCSFATTINTTLYADGLTAVSVTNGYTADSVPVYIKNFSATTATAGTRFANFFGVNTHIGWPQGNSLNPQSPGAVLSRCVALGAKSMRADVGGAGQASVMAINIAGFKSAGIQVLPCLQVISNGWNPQTQNESQAYALGFSMGFACSNRFSSTVAVIECGNELDAWKVDQSGSFKIAGSGSHRTDWLQSYWGAYRGVQRGMIDGVRAASEGHLVAINIGVPMAFPCLQMLREGSEPNGTITPSLSLDWDITSYHWYHSYGNIRAAGGPSDVPKIDVISVVAQLGKPIWLTEIGWNGGSEGNNSISSSASTYLNAALSTYYSLRVTFGIDVVHWYVMYDPGYGLISTNGTTVNPSYTSFQNFISTHGSLSA